MSREKNLWKYILTESGKTGVVFADSADEAKKKTIAFYHANGCEDDTVKVWNYMDDEGFDILNPDVVEVY